MPVRNSDPSEAYTMGGAGGGGETESDATLAAGAFREADFRGRGAEYRKPR